MTTPIIEISEVTKAYDAGPPALAGLSLTVQAVEAVAFVGTFVC
jgi:putative ABC transport system ATP-binding protein